MSGGGDSWGNLRIFLLQLEALFIGPKGLLNIYKHEHLGSVPEDLNIEKFKHRGVHDLKLF